MKNIVLLLAILCSTLLFGQDPTSTSLHISPSDTHDLYIRFENGIVNQNEVDFTNQAIKSIVGFEALQKEYNIELFRGIEL